MWVVVHGGVSARRSKEWRFSCMFTISEIYSLAVQIEKNGESFYRDGLKKISNAAVRSLLQWLADQEAKHRTWFEKRREDAGMKGEDLHLEEIGSSILRNVLGDQRFSLDEADLSKIGGVEDLLEAAIEFEKDTILFYEMVGSLGEDTATSHKLGEIIEEEKRHVQLLQELQGGGEKGSEQDESG